MGRSYRAVKYIIGSSRPSALLAAAHQVSKLEYDPASLFTVRLRRISITPMTSYLCVFQAPFCKLCIALRVAGNRGPTEQHVPVPDFRNRSWASTPDVGRRRRQFHVPDTISPVNFLRRFPICKAPMGVLRYCTSTCSQTDG